MDSMLQAFLDAGLLDIDNNDTQYEYLSKASQELADALVQNIGEVVPFTLVALDPGCTPSDPVFDRIEETLKAHWRLLRKRFPDRPRQIYRAIALEALYLAGDQRKMIFPLVWLTGSSYLPYANLNGELEICREFFREAGKLFEAGSLDTASLTKLPEPQLRRAEATQDLEEQWAASFSQHPYKGKNLQTSGRDPNPRGGQSGYFPQQDWLAEFAPRVAQLLANFYNEQLDGLSEDIGKFFDALVQRQKTLNFKSDILWWRQTLYSTSQHQSYREIDADLAAIIMAFDLHQQTPSIYPVSVDHMLRETIIEMLSWSERPATYEVNLEEYLSLINDARYREELQPLFSPETVGSGRNSLLALTQAHLYGRPISKENLRQRSGIASDVKIPLAHLAVWLFRDLQAQKIIRDEEDGKK